MIWFRPKMVIHPLREQQMDSDMEMSNLEQLPGDEDEDEDEDEDNVHEYGSNDDGAARALLTQNTQTRASQSKGPAIRVAATLWNQIGGIVVEVSISASSCPSTL
jgi:hypothetical protein